MAAGNPGKAGDIKAPGEGPAPPIVAFDFDGTLTVRDSFNAFLVWRTPAPDLLAALVALAPTLGRYVFDRDRGRLKAAAVSAFLKGEPIADLGRTAQRFAAHAAPRLLRPDALAAWARHRAEGARLVIVTASPEALVAPFAEHLGADTLIGTRLDVDAQGRLTGALDGANCRGEEKVRRLRETFGPTMRLAAAYGDTAGDREMLALAERGVMKAFSKRP